MPSLDVLAQSVASGLTMGAVYALVACGLGILYGVLKIVNFAHGEFTLLGMLLAYFVQGQLGWPLAATLALSAGVFLLVGTALEYLFVEATVLHDPETQMLLTLGLAAVIEGACTLFLAPRIHTLPAADAVSVLHLGPVILVQDRLIALAAGVGLSLVLWAISSHTTAGTVLRAVAEDPTAAALLGVPLTRWRAGAMGVSLALASVAGVLVLPFLHVAPYTGMMFTLKAFLLVMVSGMTRPLALLGAGLLLGGAEGACAAVWSESFKEVPVLLSLLAFIVLTGRLRRR